MRRVALVVVALTLTCLPGADAKPAKEAAAEAPAAMSAETFAGIELREIGPALMSGRVSDIAVHPTNRAVWYVGVASGGVWKTVNAGTTWTPVFDDQDSYSIGCVTIDERNPGTVWVGTGENNSQRSVSFGDGVYRSRDGGSSWENVGLGESEHIGKIVIDPRDSDVVYVAAQGPLWRAGGDRGLYKTTDGGETWELVLEISPDTGVTDVVLDPRNPDILLAAAYQRRRHVWTLINGGPESAIYKSADAGASWRKVDAGLPDVDLGRIGLAIAPSAPDTVYAIVEAALDEGGVFRSTDLGESWSKRSDYMSQSPQYYNELVVDPRDPDTVYSMDTWMHVTRDGGETWVKVGEKYKHVDNHALWIDPDTTDYLLAGCDGGVYESHDRGETWDFFQNLPITQFYRGTADTSEPFYFVYGGTQDNATMGGPTGTLSQSGIVNSDWFVTVFGDGFKTVVDPENPDIVYSQWQYGGLVRYDRASGELMDIQPQEAPGMAPNRWNWDSPLIISPHSHTRLYFGSQRIYRSDDRGDRWRGISGDLTRQIDRNTLPVMGRVWDIDAVAKNASTSFYGNVVSLTESPLVEGLIYAGTDDGLVQVTVDGGETWRTVRSEDLPGVPRLAYVSRLEASLHDPNTVYAAFDNHKMGDFTPYVLRSTDRGRTWTSIRGDLPDRQIVYALMQDHVRPELLFLGTEFGVWFTVDGGGRWIQLEGGIPTIAVRDLDIQRSKDDLVVPTFGRGFFILDDYSPLREVDDELLERELAVFPVRDALLYIPQQPLGLPDKGMQGDGYYTAPNPPYGAVVTYYLGEKLTTREERRREAQAEAREEEAEPPYPSFEELREEALEREPQVLITIRNADGEVVVRQEASREAGFHRAVWDLRYPTSVPIDLEGPEGLAPWEQPKRGPLAVPGTYTATVSVVADGVVQSETDPVSFEVVPLDLATIAPADRAAVLGFRQKTARLRRAVLAALEVAKETDERLEHLRAAVVETPGAEPALLADLAGLERRLEEILVELRGDLVVAGRHEPVPPAIRDRVERIVGGQWWTTSPPTATQREAYATAAEEFAVELERLRGLVTEDLVRVEEQLEDVGAPWTPGRFPEWQPE